MTVPAAAQSYPTHADAIIERLYDANHWRDHVMVVEAGVDVRPENFLQAIRDTIRMGLAIIELDAEKIANGVDVVLQDAWPDWTTTFQTDEPKAELE